MKPRHLYRCGLVGLLCLAACMRLAAQPAVQDATMTRPPELTRHRLASLVLPPTGDKSDFDGVSTECPKVIRWQDRWYMFYTGITQRDGETHEAIGLAVSDNLLDWTRLGVILSPTGGETFDGGCISAPFPYVEDGVVSLFYAGFPHAGYEAGRSLIGRATSTDLQTWHRDPRNPLLTTGPKGSWNDVKLYQSFVLREHDTYYMFYNAYGSQAGCEQIGLATGTSLDVWHPHPASPVLRQGDAKVTRDNRIIADPWVIQRDGLWWMFYFGFDGIHARDYVATSTDLLNWTKRTEWGPVLDVGRDGTYDSIHAHKPCVLKWRGCWYHFYTAVGQAMGDPHLRGIALATSRRLPRVSYR